MCCVGKGCVSIRLPLQVYFKPVESTACSDNLDLLTVIGLTVFILPDERTPTRDSKAEKKSLKLWEREEYERTETPPLPYVSSRLLFLCLFLLHAFGFTPFSMQKTANLAALLKRSSFIRLNLASPLSVFRLVLIGYRRDLDPKVRPAEFFSFPF